MQWKHDRGISTPGSLPLVSGHPCILGAVGTHLVRSRVLPAAVLTEQPPGSRSWAPALLPLPFRGAAGELQAGKQRGRWWASQGVRGRSAAAAHCGPLGATRKWASGQLGLSACGETWESACCEAARGRGPHVWGRGGGARPWGCWMWPSIHVGSCVCCPQALGVPVHCVELQAGD